MWIGNLIRDGSPIRLNREPLTAAAIATLGASGISGLSNLASGAMTRRAAKEYNKGQMQIAQMNNEWNAAEAAKNREWQESMVAQQNEYNSAYQQRQRLEAAGLNPYLMMNGGSAGSAASPSGGAQAAPAQMPSQQALQYDFSGVSNAINSYYQNQKLAADTRGSNITNSFMPDMFRYQMAAAVNGRHEWTSGAYKAARMANAPNLAINDMNTVRQGLASLRATTELSLAQGAKTGVDAEYQRIINSFASQQQQADLYIKGAQLFNMQQTGRLTRRQVETEIARTILVTAQANRAKLDYGMAQKMADMQFQAMMNQAKYESDYFRALQKYADSIAAGKGETAKFEAELKRYESETYNSTPGRWFYKPMRFALGLGANFFGK